MDRARASATRCSGVSGEMGVSTADYDVMAEIGTGSYGTVYKARDLVSGRIVALKQIRIQGGDEGVPATTTREIGLLKMLCALQNPHVVK